MKERLWKYGVNLCRLLLAVTFIFSGYVKAIDPLGTQYKIQDYLEAMGLAGMMPDMLTLLASVALSTLEFSLGVFLLLAIRRRIVTKTILAMMAVMTLVTIWIYWTDPVEDCGCFGDAVKLTNGQTLMKNIILLACAVLVCWKNRLMSLMMPRQWQWIVINLTVLFIVASSLWSLYFLPPIDFRPYYVGADIKKGMEIPVGAEQPQFETTFTLRKNGREETFTLENYPDSTWEYVATHTVQTRKGYIPPIHDFSIVDQETGQDITEQVLSHKGYTLLLVSPYLEQADDGNFGQIDQLYEFSLEQGWPMYCLTASAEKGVSYWRDITGAEYPFCTTDATTLKTMIRSNPGLLLLKGSVIVGKWSHNSLPQIEKLRQLTSAQQ